MPGSHEGRRRNDFSVGGERRRITTRSGEYPSWSPDGRRIAFASARDGDYDINVINIDGSGERTRTLPFLIRHSAFHTLDHAWEMEDKDPSGEA